VIELAGARTTFNIAAAEGDIQSRNIVVARKCRQAVSGGAQGSSFLGTQQRVGDTIGVGAVDDQAAVFGRIA